MTLIRKKRFFPAAERIDTPVSLKARVSSAGQVFGLRHWSLALASFSRPVQVCLASALLRLLEAAGVLWALLTPVCTPVVSASLVSAPTATGYVRGPY